MKKQLISKKEATELFGNQKDKSFEGILNTSSSEINNSNVYELSSGGNGRQGTGFLIKTDVLEQGINEFEAGNASEFGAWLIIHSMGHNAGSGHNSEGKAIMASGGLFGKTINPNRVVLSESGGYITGRLSGVKTFGDIFSSSINTDLPDLLKSRFGTNATDNYEKNSQIRWIRQYINKLKEE